MLRVGFERENVLLIWEGFERHWEINGEEVRREHDD